MSEKKFVDIALYDLPVSKDANDFYGRVKSKGRLNNENIAARIKKEGSEYQMETLVEILNRADRIKAEGLSDGYSIHTLFVNASMGVSGVFKDAIFDPEQHSLKARFSPSTLTSRLMQETGVSMRGMAQTGIVINAITDQLTGVVNSTITPNNVILIEGKKLKITADQANQENVGVFFTNIVTEERIKVKQILLNKNKKLMIMVPPLEVGTYSLEIVSQDNKGKILKEPRRRTFDKALSIV